MSDTTAVTAQPGAVKRKPMPARWYWQHEYGTVQPINDASTEADIRAMAERYGYHGRPVYIPGENDPPPVDPLAGLEWYVVSDTNTVYGAFAFKSEAIDFTFRTTGYRAVSRTAYLASKEKQQ